MELQKLINSASHDYYVIKCDSTSLVSEAKKLRHKIYCEEKGWEAKNIGMKGKYHG